MPTNRSRVRKALDSFIKSQPDGYKDAYSVRGKTFRLGVEELISKLVDIPNPLFDTNKLILEHVFFDGIHGKEDWLEEYESQVPCRILNTGFANGLFALKDADFGLVFNEGFQRQVQKEFRQTRTEEILRCLSVVCKIYGRKGYEPSGYQKFKEKYGGNAKHLKQSKAGN